MRIIAILSCLCLLAACGVDGEPEPREPRSGITISGTAEFGVTGSF